MFDISTNQAIKLSKGDSVQFPLFLNQGTEIKPIRYEIQAESECECHFLLFDRNNYDIPLFQKIFKPNGEIVSYQNNEYQTTVTVSSDEVINENGDFIISICSSDTINLDEGEYIYQIKVFLPSSGVEPYLEQHTVTNRLPFILIEDDYGRRIW